MKTTTTYGASIGRSPWKGGEADVVIVDGTSATGNVILRAGTTIEGHGWEQKLHVVLTPEEARAFAEEIVATLNSDQR